MAWTTWGRAARPFISRVRTITSLRRMLRPQIFLLFLLPPILKALFPIVQQMVMSITKPLLMGFEKAQRDEMLRQQQRLAELYDPEVRRRREAYRVILG